MVRGQGHGWLEIAALIPLAVAWMAQHTTTLGWSAMLLALAVEMLRWATDAGGKPTGVVPLSRASEPAVHGGEGPDEADARKPEATAGTGDSRETPESDQSLPTGGIAPPAGASLEYVSVVLLRSRADVTPEVFNASLRRRGRRDARVVPGVAERSALPTAASAFRIALGETSLDVSPYGHPLESAQLDSAVAQSWDWPEAAASVAGHEAHMVLRSVSAWHEDPPAVVGLHRAAHAALAEFTPVTAVLWPAAGRLTRSPAGSDAESATDEPAHFPRMCISYRSCRVEQGDSAVFVSDTVGLCGFGLPDVQVLTRTEPDSEVSSLVYETAQRLFFAGCRLQDDQVWPGASGEEWSMARARALCPPEREVIQLTRRDVCSRSPVQSPDDPASLSGRSEPV